LISIDVDRFRFREDDATIIANDGVVRDARDRGGACPHSMTRRDSLDARARDARGRRREMKDEGRNLGDEKGTRGDAEAAARERRPDDARGRAND